MAWSRCARCSPLADREAVAREFGRAWPAVIRVLATSTGSLDQAEEYAAVAFERAAAYPGPIDDLAAWCVTAGRRAWIDDLRRAAVQQRLARDAAVGIPAQLANNLPGSSAVDPHLPGADGLDDRVALLFVACDDVLAPGAQMVLALRLVCGLSIDQIAGHLGIEDAAAAARLTRAKRRLAQARGRFRLADDDERAERLPMVLACVAGMHTHGHRDLRRDIDPVIDLSRQALSIADSLVVLYPQDTEVRGLRAVIRLGLARRPGRLGPDGSALPLEEVDRTRWDASLIHAGLADAALAAALPGRFALDAAISGIHCVATDLASTDWPAIELLYAELYRHWPSPAVEVAALIAAGYRLRYAPDPPDPAYPADQADRADPDDAADPAGAPDQADRADWADPADLAHRRRSLVRRLEQIVEQGPGYASRDAALALADIDWHAGRTERAAARYADLADLLDGPMRAFCLRRVREARHRPG